MTNGEETEVMAASRVGKVEGIGIWVLSQHVQIDEDGQLIDQENSNIKWISHLYKPKRGCHDPVWSDIAKPEHQCNIQLPLSSNGLRNIVLALKNALDYQDSWLSTQRTYN
jgi:hypothetical protein